MTTAGGHPRNDNPRGRVSLPLDGHCERIMRGNPTSFVVASRLSAWQSLRSLAMTWLSEYLQKILQILFFGGKFFI